MTDKTDMKEFQDTVLRAEAIELAHKILTEAPMELSTAHQLLLAQALLKETDPTMLIWSNEHRAWWLPNRCGYSPHVTKAGGYSYSAAVHICRNAIPQSMHVGIVAELPVHANDVKAFLNGQLVPQAI
jgi:hypothetical protein